MTAKPSILIVDDVPENLRLLAAMLQQQGFRVRSATSSRRALEAARRAPPDLILLDICMPDLNGFEVCSQLKNDPTTQEIPVIFISAISETDDKIKAFRAGCVDYITKPFQELEVLARVKTQLKLRRQNQELEDNYRRLKELEELRNSLTHMLVHDMANPLMAIRGSLEMLEDLESASLTTAGVQHLAGAVAGTDRLMRMTSEMLLVSKLEAEKLTLKLAPCNLVTLAQKAITSKQIHVAAKVDVMMLILDRELIERVLQNLAGNALKFSPPNKKVDITISAAAGQVRVEVTDSGPGIAPEFHEKIFEKFGQVGAGASRRGTGLGLAFCKLVVEAHGGQIGVISQPGQGSTFWFTLAAMSW